MSPSWLPGSIVECSSGLSSQLPCMSTQRSRSSFPQMFSGCWINWTVILESPTSLSLHVTIIVHGIGMEWREEYFKRTAVQASRTSRRHKPCFVSQLFAKWDVISKIPINHNSFCRCLYWIVSTRIMFVCLHLLSVQSSGSLLIYFASISSPIQS